MARKSARLVERRGTYARAWSGGALSLPGPLSSVDPFVEFPSSPAHQTVTFDSTSAAAAFDSTTAWTFDEDS